MVELTPCTSSLKVAEMLAVRSTFVALIAGTRAMTVGAGFAAAVVELHDAVANATHCRAKLRIPEAGHRSHR